jgi:hypothetical protein
MYGTRVRVTHNSICDAQWCVAQATIEAGVKHADWKVTPVLTRESEFSLGDNAYYWQHNLLDRC